LHADDNCNIILQTCNNKNIALLSYNKYIHMHCSCIFRFLKYAVDFDSRPMIESNCRKFFTLRLLFGLNPLNAELNPICHLLALLGAHHFLHVSRIRVKSLILRLLMSYIYMEHLFLMFLDHTQRRTTVGRTPLDE